MENPNNFLIENVSPSKEVNNSVKTNTKEIINPKMVKIIMTGYPSLQNAIEAVNSGADAYVLKPFDVDNVLRKIKDELKRQQEAREYTEEQVTEYIITRAKELREELELRKS